METNSKYSKAFRMIILLNIWNYEQNFNCDVCFYNVHRGKPADVASIRPFHIANPASEGLLGKQLPGYSDG